MAHRQVDASTGQQAGRVHLFSSCSKASHTPAAGLSAAAQDKGTTALNFGSAKSARVNFGKPQDCELQHHSRMFHLKGGYGSGGSACLSNHS
jgi:hypothetical protein